MENYQCRHCRVRVYQIEYLIFVSGTDQHKVHFVEFKVSLLDKPFSQLFKLPVGLLRQFM